jgi:hypothetical protein
MLEPIEESFVPKLEDLEQIDLAELGAPRTGARKLEPIKESLAAKVEDLEQLDPIELGATRTGARELEPMEESLAPKLEDLEQIDLAELDAPDKGGMPGVPSALQRRHCPLRDSPSIVRGFLDIQSGFNRDFRMSKRRMGTPVHVVQ